MVFNTINKQITKALSEEGIKEPTEIQEKAIPVIMEGKDVIAYFLINPLLEKLQHSEFLY